MNDYKNTLMDRHLKRVERWLKRCITACKCGSWSDALAEAECLEAETKGLREKLWSAAEDEALGVYNRSIAHSVFAALKVVILALVMVLSAVIPISLDPEQGAFEFASQRESVVLLSSTESDIINSLRESLSSGNSGRVVISVEIPAEVKTTQSNRGAAMAAEEARPDPINTEPLIEEPPQAPETARRPSPEEIISLIQVGQRALRSSEPGVTVVQ